MPKNTQLAPVNTEILNREAWEAERDELLSAASEIASVDDETALQGAAKVQKKINGHIKALGKLRLEVTRPLDDAKKQIMAQERELIESLSSEMARIKALNDAYATKLAKAREAERRRQEQAALEAAAKRQSEVASVFGDEAVAPVYEFPAFEPDKPKVHGSRVVERWSFEVVNPSMVPREFCTPDEKKIRAWMNSQIALDKTPDMPGVRFTSKQSVEG